MALVTYDQVKVHGSENLVHSQEHLVANDEDWIDGGLEELLQREICLDHVELVGCHPVFVAYKQYSCFAENGISLRQHRQTIRC